MPSPQLKQVSINLSGDIIKPPAPAILVFPLNGLSKKIVADKELFHNVKNTAALTRNHHKGGDVGLVMIVLLTQNKQDPIHADTSGDREENETGLRVDSEMSNFTLVTTFMGVDDLLLKIQSFLSNHNFHLVHFGNACHILIHSAFLSLISGFHSFQEMNKGTIAI